MTANPSEDLIENLSEQRRSPMEGVSAETMASYDAAYAGGSPELKKAALRRVIQEHQAAVSRRAS